jgi:AraC family transcriptional regulator
MIMQPRLEILPETKLIGRRLRVSISNNRTQELWQGFKPHVAEISNRLGNDFYSVEVYDDADFFNNFDATKEFDQWAAVKVSEIKSIPNAMETINLEEGLYAVFTYKGRSSKAHNIYKYIYSNWIPESDYSLDHRPHFAVMGENYKINDASSEEEIWIPIKIK